MDYFDDRNGNGFWKYLPAVIAGLLGILAVVNVWVQGAIMRGLCFLVITALIVLLLIKRARTLESSFDATPETYEGVKAFFGIFVGTLGLIYTSIISGVAIAFLISSGKVPTSTLVIGSLLGFLLVGAHVTTRIRGFPQIISTGLFFLSGITAAGGIIVSIAALLHREGISQLYQYASGNLDFETFASDMNIVLLVVVRTIDLFLDLFMIPHQYVELMFWSIVIIFGTASGMLVDWKVSMLIVKMKSLVAGLGKLGKKEEPVEELPEEPQTIERGKEPEKRGKGPLIEKMPGSGDDEEEELAEIELGKDKNTGQLFAEKTEDEEPAEDNSLTKKGGPIRYDKGTQQWYREDPTTGKKTIIDKGW